MFDRMSSHNPYAPSKASLGARSIAPAAGAEVSVWRDRNIVVMRHDASLPSRCVKCNEPAELPTKVRTVYYAHPTIYLLFLLNFLILLIVYMIVRKKADIDPGLCAQHRQRRILGLTLGWLGFLAGTLLLILGAAGSSMPMAIIGLLLLIGAIVAGMAWGRLVWAKKIDKDEVRLGGCCAAYLVELPEYPG
jgi:hypothetical protein